MTRSSPSTAHLDPLATKRASTAPRRPSTWRIPSALIAFGLVAVLASAVRLVQLVGGPEAIPADERYDVLPAPVIIHTLGAIVYAVGGAFQFSPGLRRRHPTWHRVAGRVLVGVGIVVGMTALWMTLAYPFKEGTGRLLFATRLIVGTAMTASIVFALVAIRRRHMEQHRAWMIRAYALGLGAASQTATLGFGEALLGTDTITHDFLMAAGWAINAVIAELIIRRTPRRPLPPPTDAVSVAAATAP